MKEFFDSVRTSFGALSQNQVDGLTFLLGETKNLPIQHRAYVLSTTWHETGPASSPLHMTPRREIWGPTEAQRRYEGRADLGNTVPGDGKKFLGRGYCQITGRHNYTRASKIVGKDLVAIPDLALEPDIAAKIMLDGMTKGWFTGKKMSDYNNYRDMRRVVNGTDKADMIAKYAEAFEKALLAIPAEAPQKPQPAPPVVTPTPPLGGVTTEPKPDPEVAKPGKGIAAMVMGAIAVIIAAFAAWIMKGG